MTVLPFGDISSLYDAIATMHYHVDVNYVAFPEAAKAIKEDTYSDDCLTGAENEDRAFALYHDLVTMMNIGGFDLVKWSTHSKELLARIPNNHIISNRLMCFDS